MSAPGYGWAPSVLAEDLEALARYGGLDRPTVEVLRRSAAILASLDADPPTGGSD